MQPKMPGLVEFVALVALLSSLMALAIDAMLPALPVIGQDLHVMNANSPQLVISTVFLGMLLGQILFGPLSDSVGRKPLIYWGLGLFMLGSLVSMFAQSFEIMLLGRLLQGIGVAAPRVVTMALVRDCYSGREMAQIMSFTMIVFIMVPAIAPSLGQGILWFLDWRAIFGAFILLSAPMLIWFWLRMPETWPTEKRRPFAWHEQWEATKTVCSNRLVMGYSLVTGLVFAAFLGYLNSVQQILQEQYGLGDQFPLYFAALALSIGGASVVNAKLVMKLGMRLLSARALQVVSALSAVFLMLVLMQHGQPALWLFMAYCLVAFFSVGLLFGNLNALAMETIGDYAGIGASIIGVVSSAIAIPIGVLIGQAYNRTVIPVVLGFLVLTVLALFLQRWTERQRGKTLEMTS
ncbi:MAG: Bcr/CflA family efflux MFS transporter [Thiothrix sp.]|nr:MAG: Bcr/CflA family efflux MFS transporter [Thiothrix sp.]